MAASSGFSTIMSFFFFFLIAVLVIASSSNAIVASAENQSNLDWIPIRSGCRGTIAECLADGEEFELDSESNRRILATSRYVSYGALQKNNVPCSRRGASYYNCQKSGQANPYTRGCSAITRCRS